MEFKVKPLVAELIGTFWLVLGGCGVGVPGMCGLLGSFGLAIGLVAAAGNQDQRADHQKTNHEKRFHAGVLSSCLENWRKGK